MGTPWCADLPVVSVPAATAPKAVTFVYPYYENPRFLAQQLTWWSQYPRDLQALLSVIVVDDGSPMAPAADVVRAHPAWSGKPKPGEHRGPVPVRVLRIHQDVRWNWIGARNLGAHYAPDGWLLLTDMDHVVPTGTLASVVYLQHDPGAIYAFSRAEHTGAPLVPHPNSWLMTRAMFWRVGGYDETLSGHYGTDGDWRRRMAMTAPIQVLRDCLIRHEFVDDASTTRYLRKQPEDAVVRDLVAARRPGWRPKTLSFAHEEVPL